MRRIAPGNISSYQLGDWILTIFEKTFNSNFRKNLFPNDQQRFIADYSPSWSPEVAELAEQQRGRDGAQAIAAQEEMARFGRKPTKARGELYRPPGSTFSNVADKGDYPSEKTSALTLVELERWLALQVGGVYHQTVHSSLLKPPAAAWQDGLARRRQAPRKPADPQTFFLDLLPEEWRLIRRDGIQMFNMGLR